MNVEEEFKKHLEAEVVRLEEELNAAKASLQYWMKLNKENLSPEVLSAEPNAGTYTTGMEPYYDD